MSGSGFRIDPQTLESAGAVVGDCSTQLASALQGLQATVTSGNPWGGDGPGTLFGAAYTEVLSHALGVYGSHVEQLAVAADSLAMWAAAVMSVDADTQAAIDSIAVPGA